MAFPIHYVAISICQMLSLSWGAPLFAQESYQHPMMSPCAPNFSTPSYDTYPRFGQYRCPFLTRTKETHQVPMMSHSAPTQLIDSCFDLPLCWWDRFFLPFVNRFHHEVYVFHGSFDPALFCIVEHSHPMNSSTRRGHDSVYISIFLITFLYFIVFVIRLISLEASTRRRSRA